MSDLALAILILDHEVTINEKIFFSFCKTLFFKIWVAYALAPVGSAPGLFLALFSRVSSGSKFSFVQPSKFFKAVKELNIPSI